MRMSLGFIKGDPICQIHFNARKHLYFRDDTKTRVRYRGIRMRDGKHRLKAGDGMTHSPCSRGSQPQGRVQVLRCITAGNPDQENIVGMESH
jgi:hypothetical protein